MFEKVPKAEEYWLKAQQRWLEIRSGQRKGVAQVGMSIVYVIVAVLIAVILFAALYPTVVTQEQSVYTNLTATAPGAASLLKTTVETILPIAIVIAILFVAIGVMSRKK